MDTLAFFLGTLGTILWAAGWAKGWEGVFWLASSLFWIVHAANTSQHPLLARDLLGLGLYSVACWRMLILPRLKSRVLPETEQIATQAAEGWNEEGHTKDLEKLPSTPDCPAQPDSPQETTLQGSLQANLEPAVPACQGASAFSSGV